MYPTNIEHQCKSSEKRGIIQNRVIWCILEKGSEKKITESNTLCNQFQDISIHILDEIPQKKCFILTHTKIINNRSVIHRII